MLDFAECRKKGMRVLIEGAVMEYIGKGGKFLEIPEGVRVIAPQAFSSLSRERRAVENIVCPSTLKAIDKEAFSGAGLFSIELNNGIEEIGQYAFCANRLSQIVLPDSVKEVECGAFEANGDLSVMKLSSKMETIPKRMCRDCALKGIVIPEGVKKIGREAFSNNCMSVIVIPSSVEFIDKKAFKNSLWTKKRQKHVVAVYYMGTEEEWKKIKIKSGNKEIKKNVKFVGSIPSELLFDSDLRKKRQP